MGRVKLWIGGIFAPIGLVFLAIAGWTYSDSASFIAEGVAADGVVVDLDRRTDSDGDATYAPVVEFRDAAGRRHVFIGGVSSNPPSYARGDRVELAYAPGNPDSAMLTGFWERYFLPLLFGLLGAIFATIGIGLLVSWLRRRSTIDRLRNSGLPIQADFLECYCDTSTRVNGRSPYRVVAQATHPATGKLHRFESEPIWIDPTGELRGKTVRVLVDPADPGHSYMDLSGTVDGSMQA